MDGGDGCGGDVVSGMFNRPVMIAGLLAVLSGCALGPMTSDGYERVHRATPIDHRVSDKSYKELRLSWKGTYEGNTSRIFLKRFRENGMLVICGFRIYADGMASSLEDLWFAKARIVIDQVEVTKTRFFLSQGAKYAKEAEVASCVNTGWPAAKSLMEGVIGFDGGKVRDHAI